MIWESAVDIVAEKIPAKIPPTNILGNNCSARIGNASSASPVINSGNNIRAVSPTKIEPNEKIKYLTFNSSCCHSFNDISL